MAEAERRQQHEALVGIGDGFADQVLAGDAEMSAALRELARDLGGGEEEHLDVRHAGDAAAIVARAAALDQRQAGAREEREGVLLQPALGGHGEGERRIGRHGRCAHERCLRGKTVEPDGAPDGGDGTGRAKGLQQPVVAAAADDRLAVRSARIADFEHRAGVIVEVAAEGGGEGEGGHVDAARRDEAGARVEGVERGGEVEPGFGRERPQLGGCGVGIAR